MSEKPRKVRILDVREVPSTDPERFGKMDVLITYQVDPMHVYIIRLPKEEFNEERVREAIRADLEEKAKWLGRELEL